MAYCYLIMAMRIDGRAAVDQKNQITCDAMSSGNAYGHRFTRMVQRLLKAAEGGVRDGNLYGTILDSTATLPTGNIACVQANAAGDTITFTYGGQTIVLTEGVDFARGASNTTCAAALAAAINNHPILGPLYTATGSVGNCQLVAKVPTALLQDIAMTTSDGTAFTFTQLTGGDEGAAQFFIRHFPMNRTP